MKAFYAKYIRLVGVAGIIVAVDQITKALISVSYTHLRAHET